MEEEWNDLVIDKIKSATDKIHSVEKIKKMCQEMLNEIVNLNKDLDEQYKVSTEHINNNITYYNILIEERKKFLKSALKELAFNFNIKL